MINHFLIPDENEAMLTDNRFLSIGINATDNIFYSKMYLNDCKILKINEKVSVICCKTIFNSDYAVKADISNAGRPISGEDKSNSESITL